MIMKSQPKKKKSKIKQKRRRIALLLIILLIMFIHWLIFRAKNYEKTYQIDEYQIKEKFNKNLKSYTFEIQKENNIWHFIIEHKYIKKKKLITEIEYIEKNDINCIIPKSENLETYPQCIQNNQLIDYHLVLDEIKDLIDEKYNRTLESKKENYENITIKNLDDNTYYVWNYKGFYMIHKNEKKNIPIFSKDIYDISNVTFVKDYLVIPDYNESYYFNKFYFIQMKNGSLSTWEFKDSLYFDGYYLGSDKNSLFYVDKKTKTEWEIWPKKKRMRKIGTEKSDGKILKEDNWEKISLTKLTTDNYKFTKKEAYHYEIDDGLYVTYMDCNTRKKISEKKIKEIVATLNNKVYYFVGDTLYYYTESTGEVEIMTFFEWNFNYKNMIFIREN